MNSARLPMMLVLLLCILTPALAGDRPDHYEGLPAETLDEAVANFSEYNRKLAAVLEKDELTAEDLDRIHQLTYTLENALGKINREFTELAETLESVHIASETADRETVAEAGRAYLATSRKVVE